jgi:hypothetical protein
MIEYADCLKTWRLDNPPEKLASQKTTATPIFDHDKKFLTYQGSVNSSKGSVEIVDQGLCKIESSDKHNLKIKFEGKILKGIFDFGCNL